MDDNSLVLARDIKIGDVLKYGGEVDGVAHHRIDGVSVYKDIPIAPGSWILNEDGVIPVTEIHSTKTLEYIQFITRACHYAVASPTGEFVILDDHEVSDEDIHTWRDNEIQKEVV